MPSPSPKEHTRGEHCCPQWPYPVSFLPTLLDSATSQDQLQHSMYLTSRWKLAMLPLYHDWWCTVCWYYTQTHSMHRKVFASICLLAHSWVLLMSSFSSNTRLDSGPIPPPPKQVLISLSLITWTSITFFRGSLSLHRLLTYHPESLAVKFLNPWVHALLKGTRKEISSEMVGFPMHLENIHPNIRLVALYEVIFFSICVWMICFRQWWDCIR